MLALIQITATTLRSLCVIYSMDDRHLATMAVVKLPLTTFIPIFPFDFSWVMTVSYSIVRPRNPT
jgi:hypothetical protein